MKGVLLAGGLGTRLGEASKVTNKHLLPVNGDPMIYYPLRTMAEAGVDQVLIVGGGKSTGAIVQLIGNGAQFGFKNLYYAFQEGEGGIADAIGLAESFVGRDEFLVVLGDNLFTTSLKPFVDSYCGLGASILLKEVADDQVERFGIAEVDDATVVQTILEKPKLSDTSSRLAVLGAYIYDHAAFVFIKERVRPSERNEKEVTDLNNCYLKEGRIQGQVYVGDWFDLGEMDTLLDASIYLRENN